MYSNENHFIIYKKKIEMKKMTIMVKTYEMEIM